MTSDHGRIREGDTWTNWNRPPSVEIRALNNMINRYLAVTMPQDARIATGGNVQIIMYLARHEERDVFQYDIERRFSVTRSTASRVLGLMERKGLIERRSVAHDARLRKIVLTDKARDIVEVLAHSGEDMERTLIAGMTPEDLERFAGYVALMKSNLAATGLVGDCGRATARDASEDADESTVDKNDDKEGMETI